MPSTDTDGTPLFILGANDAVKLLSMLRGEGGCFELYEKLLTFCEDSQVIEWLNTQRENDA